jgi:hypothetical protein
MTQEETVNPLTKKRRTGWDGQWHMHGSCEETRMRGRLWRGYDDYIRFAT